MIETVVDLTYRGLALARRIKLTQLRPTSATIELAAPMPVGSHVAIVSDDGVTIDATVVWVHEQVAGVDRPSAMVVSPALAAEDAATWWRARVTHPDEHWATPRPRSRSVTVRPRTRTQPDPAPDGATTDEVPTIIADLEARVTAAAGLAPRPASASRPPVNDPAIRISGDYAIVDDGRHTLTMPMVDTTEQDLAPVAASGEPRAPDDTTPPGDAGGPVGAGQ